jgi:hypothetical protein
MRKSLRIDLVDRAALVASLAAKPPDAAVAAEPMNAERALRELRDGYARASARVQELRATVGEGHATVADLEAAVRERDTAALVISPAEARVTRARAALEAAQRAAAEGVVRDAARWRDEFQAVADMLAPVLEELRVLEGALDDVVRAVDPRSPGVEPLRWPMTLDDQGRLQQNAAAMIAGSMVAAKA